MCLISRTYISRSFIEPNKSYILVTLWHGNGLLVIRLLSFCCPQYILLTSLWSCVNIPSNILYRSTNNTLFSYKTYLIIYKILPKLIASFYHRKECVLICFHTSERCLVLFLATSNDKTDTEMRVSDIFLHLFIDSRLTYLWIWWRYKAEQWIYSLVISQVPHFLWNINANA